MERRPRQRSPGCTMQTPGGRLAIPPQQILAKAIFKARAAPEPFAWPFPYESIGNS